MAKSAGGGKGGSGNNGKGGSSGGGKGNTGGGKGFPGWPSTHTGMLSGTGRANNSPGGGTAK